MGCAAVSVAKKTLPNVMLARRFSAKCHGKLTTPQQGARPWVQPPLVGMLLDVRISPCACHPFLCLSGVTLRRWSAHGGVTNRRKHAPDVSEGVWPRSRGRNFVTAMLYSSGVMRAKLRLISF